MAKRWFLAALLACGLASAPAQAQWGLGGLDATAIPPDAASQSAANLPSLDLSVDYLMWWLRDPRLSIPITIGALTVPQDGINYSDPFSGARVNGRFWIDDTQMASFEFAGLIVAENSYPVLVPAATGGLLVSASSQMWGAEANLVVDLLPYGIDRQYELELIGGFRTLDLQEHLDLLFVTAAASESQFETRNQFYGGQIGARASYRLGPIILGAQGKVAFGSTHQSLNISGIAGAGGGGFVPGAGPFVGAANVGRYVQNVFSILPEAEGRIGIEVAGGVILYASCNALWLTHVLRPGDQLSGSAAAPAAPPLTDTYLWARGFNFGVEVRY